MWLSLTLMLACGSQEEPRPAELLSTDASATLPAADEAVQVETPTKPMADRIAASHILLAYKGAVAADATVSRSRSEARTAAEEAHQQVEAGRDFAELAVSVSDGPTAPRGGVLGAFEPGVMHEAFDAIAFRLEIEEHSGVVETPFGFHIIRRDPLDEIQVAHVLVQWKGASRSKTTRTKPEAKAIADEALTALDLGTPIAEVAAKFSDGPTASRGGDLGWFQRGQMVPAFDASAFGLNVGQVSQVVESPLGFHIIMRLQ